MDAINDIVPIYEKSKLSPNATGDKLYNEHSGAGFSGSYFNLAQYGRILAIHLDKVLGLKSKDNIELTKNGLTTAHCRIRWSRAYDWSCVPGGVDCTAEIFYFIIVKSIFKANDIEMVP